MRLALSLLVLLLAGSVVVAATVIHLPAVLVVTIGTGLVRSTATKGTVRLLLGLVTALATWTLAGAVLGNGWGAVAWGVAVAFLGGIALAGVDPAGSRGPDTGRTASGPRSRRAAGAGTRRTIPRCRPRPRQYRIRR